jgi:hypothetical protein
MKTAVEKLRENMDQIQQQIDDSLGRLERSSLSINLEVLESHFADYGRISGDMSDLKYGNTDQHVTRGLKVQQLMRRD